MTGGKACATQNQEREDKQGKTRSPATLSFTAKAQTQPPDPNNSTMEHQQEHTKKQRQQIRDTTREPCETKAALQNNSALLQSTQPSTTSRPFLFSSDKAHVFKNSSDFTREILLKHWLPLLALEKHTKHNNASFNASIIEELRLIWWLFSPSRIPP